MKASYLFLVLTWFCGGVYAYDYPEEFADFFTPKNASIRVLLAGDSVGQHVNASVSYESFRLLGLDDEHPALRSYLVNNQLTTKAIDRIISDLLNGVPADPGCEVSLDVCKPVISESQVNYVFDADNGNLTIYVGSQLLARTVMEVQYHPASRSDNALVNQARIYSYIDDTLSEFNAANLTTLGLPYGYLQFNTQYQGTENQFDVYRGMYDLEIGGVRTVIGYSSERDRVRFNSTDFLNDDANYTAFFAQVGTSRNLIVGGASSVQSVDFFAPQTGQLEVYRGDRLLLSKVVSAGRQSISYSDLPSGSYDITLILKVPGSEVLREQRQIVNSNQFSLPVGAWDGVLTAGRLEGISVQSELSWHYFPELMPTDFGQARISWRMADGVLLAGALTSNQDDWFTQLGVNLVWSDWLRSTYQFGQFSSDDFYQSGSLNIGPFFLSARRFDSNVNNRWYRLSSSLYGEHSFFNYSATYNFKLGSGNGYIAYSRYESEAPYTLTELQLQNGDNLSAGWMIPMFGGKLSLNATYNNAANYDNLNAGVYWSYVFGDNWSSQLSMLSDKSGISRTDVGVTSSMSNGRWSGVATATAARLLGQQESTEGSLSGMVSGSSDLANVGAYVYANNMGQHMLSGTFTGSQFLSLHSAGMSNEMSSSFFHVVPNIQISPDEDRISLDDINYNIRRDKRGAYQGNLGQSNAVIALTPYADTEFVMDAETRSVEIEKPTRREFTYPGTVYTIDTRITPLVSQLFVLSDFLGRPVTQARCIGDACQSVERVSDDGVFRVNYRQGGEMKLMSSNSVCINRASMSRSQVVHTYCLPGLDKNEGGIDLTRQCVADEGGTYLDQFPDNQDTTKILSKLKSVGLLTHVVKLDRQLYVYVKCNKQYTIAQRALLDSLGTHTALN